MNREGKLTLGGILRQDDAAFTTSPLRAESNVHGRAFNYGQ